MRTIDDLKEEVAELDGMIEYLTARKHERLLKVQRKEKDVAKLAAWLKATDVVEKHLKAVSK